MFAWKAWEEKEKGACLLTDGLTAAWHSVCSYWNAWIVRLLNLLSFWVLQLCPFLFVYFSCFCFFVCLPLLPCYHIGSSCCNRLEVLHPQWSFYTQLYSEVCFFGLNSCHKLKVGEERITLWMWFLFKSLKYEFISWHLIGLLLGDEQHS